MTKPFMCSHLNEGHPAIVSIGAEFCLAFCSFIISLYIWRNESDQKSLPVVNLLLGTRWGPVMGKEFTMLGDPDGCKLKVLVQRGRGVSYIKLKGVPVVPFGVKNCRGFFLPLALRVLKRSHRRNKGEKS